MGAELADAVPGGPGPATFLRIGHFPGPQDTHGRCDGAFFHRCGHCTRIAEYIPAHRRPNSDIVWLLGSSLGLRDSQRDIAEEVEAE